MAKAKVHRSNPRIDMTPMVDLFTLLLTFFMLTASFAPSEAVVVDTPNSISEKPAPDKNLMTIYIDSIDRVFYNVDNGKDTSTHLRKKVLIEMGKQFRSNVSPNGIEFTEKELEKFEKLGSFGLSMTDMKKWINAKDETERSQYNYGIPFDSIDNQLFKWVRYTRILNDKIEASVKGDGNADIETAKKVFDVLLDNNLSRFNLTTNLEKVEIKISDYK